MAANQEDVQQAMQQLLETNRELQEAQRQARTDMTELAARLEQATATIATLQQQQQQQSTRDAANGAGAAVTPPIRSPGIDTRSLGKPEIFEGKMEKWKDWYIVVKSYISAIDHNAGPLMNRAETSSLPILNVNLDAATRAISTQLYYVLTMTCRGVALDRVVNAGSGEGLEAWRLLVAAHDPRVGTRHAGMLLELLSFSFEGDILSRLEAFERKIVDYEMHTRVQMTAEIRIGTVVRQLPEGALKQHLILNMDKYDTWDEFKFEIQNLKRAQAAAQSGPMPMNIDSLSSQQLQGLANQMAALGYKGKGKGKAKGGKGQKGKSNQYQRHNNLSQSRTKTSGSPCQICNRPGHTKSDCWYNQDRAQQPKGKGKKGGRGAGKGDSRTCWKCGQTGHVSSRHVSDIVPKVVALAAAALFALRRAVAQRLQQHLVHELLHRHAVLRGARFPESHEQEAQGRHARCSAGRQSAGQVKSMYKCDRSTPQTYHAFRGDHRRETVGVVALALDDVGVALDGEVLVQPKGLGGARLDLVELVQNRIVLRNLGLGLARRSREPPDDLIIAGPRTLLPGRFLLLPAHEVHADELTPPAMQHLVQHPLSRLIHYGRSGGAGGAGGAGGGGGSHLGGGGGEGGGGSHLGRIVFFSFGQEGERASFRFLPFATAKSI